MLNINDINQYEEEIVKALQGYIKIKSVEEPALPDKPFGEGPYRALKYILDLGEKLGFEVENYDNYAGHIEMGQGDEIFGVLVHCDVVPEGGDWDYDPYGAEVVGDKLYGRGTIDNKGPAIAALYAMKALKDQGVELKRRIRLIVGTNEETGWKGISYYMDRAEKPALGFSPDAEFPVIHAEMGIITFDLIRKRKDEKNLKGLQLKSISGGNASNMVPDFAKAVVSDENYDAVKEAINLFNMENEYKIYARLRGKSLEISAHGVSAHGARPHLGQNAISILLKFLGRLPFASEDVKEFIDFYNTRIGFELHGNSIGIGLSDEVSGNLVFNVGVIDVDMKTMGLTINVRYPVTLNSDIVYEDLRKVTDDYSFGIIKQEEKLPLYMPKDHELVTTLMDVYQRHTGDCESEPVVMGGGTYARAIKNAVAFGAKFLDDEALEHQKNEYIKISSLMKATKIYTDALYQLNAE